MTDHSFDLTQGCDICGATLTGQPFVGGRTHGGWAVMCLTCHKIHGVGLGTGRGQKYDAQGRKVEG